MASPSTVASSGDIKSGEENIIYLSQVARLERSLASSASASLLFKAGTTGGDLNISSAANITAPSYALDYDLGSMEIDNFKDRIAFPSSQFTEETTALEQLNDLLTAGQQYISMLYSYRSCSKAIPMVQGDAEEAEKLDIHKKTFNILRPQILKLKDFMEFHEKAVGIIRVNVLLVQKADAAKSVQSEPLLDLLIDAIDMLVLLDALKDMRGALQNDFSRYKRAFTPIRASLADSDALNDEIHTMQMFLSNPQQAHDLIMSHLKTDVHKVPNFEIVLSLLINHAMECIEKGMHLLPKELHAYYRVLPHLLYLADSDDKSKGGLNIFKVQSSDKIKFNLAHMQKLFKAFPIIPLYADMHIDVMFVLRRCPHWDEETMREQWVTNRPAKLRERYELLYHRQKIRADYNEFTSRFTTLLNEIQAFTAAKRIITPKMLQTIFSSVLEGLKLLSSWSARINEQCAYKYSRPKSDAEFAAAGGKAVDQDGKPMPGLEFEKAVRFNYSKEELYALIDVIGMLKGLGGLMIESQLIHEPLVRRCIHDDTQIFLQQELARPLRKAHKKNKKIKDVMLQMRDIGCDWVNREAQKDDFLQKKEVLLQANRDFPRRAVAPSITMMHLVRRMMHSIFSPDAPGMQGGMFTEKDLKKEWIPVWDEFYYNSYFFPYLLIFPETIRAITDLSFLWYREFYLEVTKQIQFPISMSMPWIMTEFLITTPSMKENIFFPMDIYNDAASVALYGLKQQFLYDEIEAELNLSFEQLLYHLAEDIFKYFKTLASTILVNKSYDAKFFASPAAKAARATFVESRYISLMSQRNIQLLGRNVNLNSLLSVSINEYLRKNVDYILRRFESADLCRGLIDLRFLFDNVQMMHLLLGEYLTLDPFDQMWAEVNDDVNLGQKRGRVVSHIFSELMADLLPSFVFCEATQRFVRSQPELVTQPDRARYPSSAPKWYWHGRRHDRVFDRYTSMYYGFFGHEHIEAMLHVLHATELPLIVNELTTEIENKILYDFHPYFKALIEALPPMKLPKLAYGVVGGHGFFEVKLKNSIGGYEPLRPAVFQMLREIGNAVCFVRALELVQKAESNWSFQQHAHFGGVRTHPMRLANSVPTQPPSSAFQMPPAGSVPSLLQAMRDAAKNYPTSAAKPLNQSLVDDAVRIAEDGLANLYRYEDQNGSLLTGMLARLRHQIAHTIGGDWNGPANSLANPLEIESPKTLARLLTCLQFLYCSPTEAAADINDFSTFGESWSWGVCTLVHISGQRRKFELLDLGLHVLRLDSMAPIDRDRLDAVFASKKVGKVTPQDHVERSILEFLSLVQLVRSRNDAMLDSLESYLAPVEPTRFAVPPVDESQINATIVPAGAIQAGSRATLSMSMSPIRPSVSQAITPSTPQPPPSAPSAPAFAPTPAPPPAAPIPPPAAPPAAPAPPMAPPAPPAAPPAPPMAPAAPPMAPALPPMAPPPPVAGPPPPAPPIPSPAGPIAPPPPGPPPPGHRMSISNAAPPVPAAPRLSVAAGAGGAIQPPPGPPPPPGPFSGVAPPGGPPPPPGPPPGAPGAPAPPPPPPRAAGIAPPPGAPPPPPPRM